MVRAGQCLSNPDEKSFPAISFYCSCRKRLYRISTNVLACRGRLTCERCGKHYVWLDSLIAISVSSARVAKALIANLEPSQSPRRRTGNGD